ncbi:MAG: hypothetical protein LBG57_04415 [Treponema sp.]|jgi:hypothetical protein|nr:hypothetical protein [Treponema sp.]
MKKLCRLIAATVFLASARALPAEQEFALSLFPALEVPAGKAHFGPGAGAAAALDWAFLPFRNCQTIR